MLDLIYIWYDDRYWSKVLFTTIPTPACDLKVKVTTVGNFSKFNSAVKESYFNFNLEANFAVSCSDVAHSCDMD